MIRKFFKRGLQRVAGAMGIDDIAREVKKLREICTQIQYQITVAPDGLPLGSGLLVDRNIGVGIVPPGKEILKKYNGR
jgi:hypothetical protein